MTNNRAKQNLRKMRNSKTNKTYSKRKTIRGGYGSSNFSELPTKYYYSTNNYNDDPNNPTIMQSGHLTNITLRGGKSRKHKKINKSRKMKKDSMTSIV